MTRISTPVQIPLPVQIVFEYVTTPGHWPEWHPSSLGVSGATDHSLEIGEQVTEEFLVAGRRGQAIWTVIERVVPSRWVIEGEVNGRKSGIVRYTLAPQGNGTSFQREFVYSMPNFLFGLLDRFVLRRRIEAESKQAVQQLRSALLRQQGNVAKETGP
jgi:uncharacterized protein YndB with AHSA1/START domain